jgi:hypothetical protein
VIGQQRMLTPPRHLIPSLIIPEVRVSPVFTVDCSLTGIQCLWIVPLPDLDALTLTAVCFVT